MKTMRAASIIAWFALCVLLLAGCGGGSSTTGNTGGAPSGLGNVTVPAAVPTSPTGVTAVGGTNQVEISWSQVSGATAYNIYWTDDPTHVMKEMSAAKIAAVASPFRHTSLPVSSTYAYVVTALNASGESVESTIVSAVTTEHDGVALYNSYCGSCHNPLSISEKKGRTAAQTWDAITVNKGRMGSLTTLTAAEVEAIADVLAW